MAIEPGDIISHAQMCMEEGISLQRGMNFRIKGDTTVILMSIRKGAPYFDKVEDDGRTLVYEGHDVSKKISKYPKSVDQPSTNPGGGLTQNGKFLKAVDDYKNGASAELVKVYEKIKDGIWTYNGIFELIDAWTEKSDTRNVFKFKLRITDNSANHKINKVKELPEIDHNRIIPTAVKLEVWKRDDGRCVQCKSTDNLHFDHILPYSKGGTSLKAENIQLLCARHNLQKHDQII
jgi:hypothetical protein